MNTDFWRECDEILSPHYLDKNDICYYAREQLHEGYSASDSNSLIFNYKKPVKYRNTNHWIYKEKAIEQFAKELKLLKLPDNAVLIPCPTSKPKGHHEYDSRILDTLNIFISKYRPDIKIEESVDVINPVPSAHAEGGTRNPDEIIKNYRWKGFTGDAPKTAFIVDDVINTAGHFKAVKNFIRSNVSSIKLYGVFWAIHIHNSSVGNTTS